MKILKIIFITLTCLKSFGQQIIKVPEPIVVETPKITEIKKNDNVKESLFNIRITEKKYQIKFQNKNLTFVKIEEIENYINTNKKLIYKNKILITHSKKIKNNRIKPIMEILIRQKMMNFNLVTEK